MTFTNLAPYLADKVAPACLKYLTDRLGRSGLKIEEQIDANVSWRPTFFFYPTKFQIIAVEVSESIYPSILKEAAHDLLHEYSDIQVSVYVACPLEVLQGDSRQAVGNRLRAHGFGLLTVDDVGQVIEQFGCPALIHFISEHDFFEKLDGIPKGIAVHFHSAYRTYRTNANQGLQEAGQIVEGLVFCLARQSKKKGYINSQRSKAADVVDDLYACTTSPLKDHRASLGAARDFLKIYRNPSSHPPKTAKEAAKRVKNCREGFIQATRTTKQLTVAMRAMGFIPKVYLPE